jgi:hypothetical protein
MPLRFISRNPNLRIIVNSLIDSISGIFSVIVVIFIIWLMFAILFMNLYGDMSYYCWGPDIYYGINKS